MYAPRAGFTKSSPLARANIFSPKLDKPFSMQAHVRGGGRGAFLRRRFVILCAVAMFCRLIVATLDGADALDLQTLLNMKVVTASKFRQDLADAPGVIRVVSRDEIQRFGGLTLREVLERVAGAGTHHQLLSPTEASSPLAATRPRPTEGISFS